MAFGLPSASAFWGLAKKIESLLALEAKQAEAISALREQIAVLSSRMDKLEAREEIVVAKAEGAARAAAMGSATIAVADLARRIGGMEERMRLARSKPLIADDPPEQR